MPRKDLHKEPFSEETITKLEIFLAFDASAIEKSEEEPESLD